MNAQSGRISGIISYSAAETSGGQYNVLVMAIDGHGASAGTAFAWTVTDTDRSPSITNPGAESSVAGTTVSLQVVAGDPDPNQALAYTATGLPPGLTIGPDNGLISGAIGSQAAG